MDIIVKARRTSIPERFRQYAAGKLTKIEKLDHKAIRIDVEVTKERNPRQADRRDRVELTIRSRGPVIRAEAAAEDRFAAFDLAFAKLEARLRKSCDRRKQRHAERVPTHAVAAAAEPQGGPRTVVESADLGEPTGQPRRPVPPQPRPPGTSPAEAPVESVPGSSAGPAAGAPVEESAERLVPIPAAGDGPLIVREKLHTAAPMTIDQALLEMELVGHDFYLFHDSACDLFSVVYRRRGYDYGVIRLLEKPVAGAAGRAR